MSDEPREPPHGFTHEEVFRVADHVREINPPRMRTPHEHGVHSWKVAVDAMVCAMEHFYAMNPCGCPPNDIGGQWIHRDGCRFSYSSAPELPPILAGVLAEVARLDGLNATSQEARKVMESMGSLYRSSVTAGECQFLAAHAIREAMRLKAGDAT
jgi:hypothetical protein